MCNVHLVKFLLLGRVWFYFYVNNDLVYHSHSAFMFMLKMAVIVLLCLC